MRRKESLQPIAYFALGVLVFGFGAGFAEKTYYQQVSNPPVPVVKADSRKLVDECGNFMWVEWVTPPDASIDRPVPYVPMRDRVKQKQR
jgi:hypothetical protein